MESSTPKMYIYELPYSARKNLCRILDLNDTWEELGGSYMKYDVSTLQRVAQAVLRNNSPTDELLMMWGTQNHTVAELFVLLSKMQHYQAMKVLKPLVDTKFHRLIYEGEENFSRIVQMNTSKTSNQGPSSGPPHEDPAMAKDLSYGEHNINYGPGSGNKVLSDKPSVVNQEEVKVLNTPPKNTSDGAQSKGKVSGQSNATIGEALSPMISYCELDRATCGWDKRYLLGKGGFGTVYRGVWKNTQVAVKRLEVQKGGDLEEIWKTQREQSLRELKYLMSYRHDNILPLYGYCIEGPHDCLVYQYMPNGSLEDRILCREQSIPLNWSQRQNISLGTARGLQFLHTIGDKPLVHGDIKSANILLDPHLEPKIGDFGLAREGPLQQYTHVKVSRVHGTRPYLPDEFLRSKKLSTKVDTYSFGIVLFELATGLRAYDESRSQKFLKGHVDEALREEKVNEIRDIKGGYDDGLVFASLIALGIHCTNSKAKDRPQMDSVLQVIGSPREMAKHAQYLIRHNSLTPATPYDLQVMHDQRRFSLQPNQNIQVGGASNRVGSPLMALAVSPPNGRSISPYVTNSRPNSPYMATPPPSNSLHTPLPNIQILPPPGLNTLQNSPSLPSNIATPSIKEASGDCDLPLISELGIKSSHTVKSFEGSASSD